MNTTLLITVMFAQAADAQAISQLFDALDKDGNGRVTASEISDAQRPYFQRALRVSDHNEDGALSQEELLIAVKDPTRVAVSPASRFGSAAQPGFNPASLDRNKDGFISQDEVPTQLLSRFKQALDRGQGRISLEAFNAYRNGAQPPAAKTAAKNAADRMQKEEAKVKPPEVRPGARMGSMMDKKKMSGRPAVGSPDSFFERLDENKDGRLTGTEIPQRHRQAVRRFDRNSDQAISKAEFAEVMSSMRGGSNN